MPRRQDARRRRREEVYAHAYRHARNDFERLLAEWRYLRSVLGQGVSANAGDALRELTRAIRQARETIQSQERS